MYEFLWKCINLSKKYFWEKHQSSEANKFWRAAKQVSHFSIIFKFYMQFLLISESSKNIPFSKIILTFWNFVGFVSPSPNFVQNLHLLSNFLWNTFVWMFVGNEDKITKKLRLGFPPFLSGTPPPPQISKSSFIIQFWLYFLWNISNSILVENENPPFPLKF